MESWAHTSQRSQPLQKHAARATKSKSVRLAMAYKTSRSCMLFTSMVTVASCLFYILGTYLSEKYVVAAFEAVFAVVFFVDYLLSLIAAPMWFAYAWSAEGVIDLLSIVPVFGAFRKWIFNFSFIRYLRLLKTTRIMQNHRLLDKVGTFSDVTVRACLLGVKVTGLILMTTAIIYGTEEAVESEDDENAFADDGMEWHDAFYLTIVTLSTVGYGDVTPLQPFSRMLMVVVILFALTYVPVEIGNLVDVVSSRPKNRVGFPLSLVGNELHVILAMVAVGDGDDTGFEPRLLRRIIEELCHEDHGMDNESLWVVVMAPCPPSAEVQSVLRTPRFLSRVLYYRGDVMDPLDMAAVCAEYADCIFLYPSSKSGLSDGLVEEKTSLAAKSIQRYLDRTPTDAALMSRVAEQSVTGLPCRTLVTVKDLRSKEQLLRFGIDHVICHDEFKMSMMATATLYSSFLPFAINAMRSSSDNDGKATNNSGGVVQAVPAREGDGESEGASGGIGDWLVDYKDGMEYEVYSLPLVVPARSRLYGMSFGRAALDLYRASKGKVLLMAIVRDLMDHPNPEVAATVAGAQQAASSSRAASTRDAGPSATISSIHATSSELTEPTGGAPCARDGISLKEGVDTSAIHTGDGSSPLKVDASSVLGGGGGGGGGRDADPEGAAAGTSQAFVHVSIFPDDKFHFSGECHVLVMAEDKRAAERCLHDLQTSGPASLALEHHGVVDTTSSAPPTAEAISSRFVDLEDKKVDSSTAPTAAAADDGSTDRHMPQVSDSRHQSSPAPTAMSAPARPMPTPGLEQHDSSGDTAGDIGSVGHGGALGGGARGARVIDASPSELVAGREERGNVRTRERGELEEEKREIGEEGGRRSVSPEGVGEETEAEGEAGLLAVAVGAVSAAASTATAALSTFSGAEHNNEAASTTRVIEEKMTEMTAQNKVTKITGTAEGEEAPRTPPTPAAHQPQALSSLFPTSKKGAIGVGSTGIMGNTSPARRSVLSFASSGAGACSPHAGSMTSWDGASSTGRRSAKSHRKRLSRTESTQGGGWYQTEEERAQLESVREEIRNEDGIRWTEALGALKMATDKLKDLERMAITEDDISDNPVAFFEKVEDASHELDEALRVHAAAVPEDLTGHFVLMGSHPRLQHYILSLRRRRPDVAVVIITHDQEMYSILRERLAEAKCKEVDVNITKIYSVFGRTQDQGTFAEARMADAEAVVLVSDEASDSEVLLVSFELEQMLADLPRGTRAPKVLIDLHNDNSIYYCGNTLGRGGVPSTTVHSIHSGANTGRLRQNPGLTASGVWEWPLFAAGRVWTESIMEVFAVQTYFSTEFLGFFETLLQIQRPVLVGSQLVHDTSFNQQPRASETAGIGNALLGQARQGGTGGAGVTKSQEAPISGEGGGDDASSDGGVGQRAQYDQLDVSNKFVGKRYEVLAHELILLGAMPLGLYRPAGTKESTLPYTQVNPDTEELLVRGDVVFVLRSRTCSLVDSV